MRINLIHSLDIYYLMNHTWLITFILILKCCDSLRIQRGNGAFDKEINVLVRKAHKPLELAVQKTYSRQEIEGEPLCGSSVPEVANATWAYTAKDGSSVRYSCNIGFSLPGGDVSFDFTCSAGQALPKKIQRACKPVTCLAPPAIPHAVMNWPYKSRFADFGIVVEFNCAEGYSGDGHARGPRVIKQQCSQSGEFEFVLPTITECKLIYCSPPIRVLNGVLVDGQVDEQSPVPFNQTLKYACNPGFVLTNDSTLTNFTLTCGDDGEFLPNDPIPTCTEAVCGVPPVLPLARTPQRSGKVKVGTRVLYRCDPGFFVSEIPASTTFNVRCDFINNTAQFVVPPPEEQCHPNVCGPIPNLVHSHLDTSQSDFHYQDIVPFACDEGYSLGGEPGEVTFTGSCDIHGFWTLTDDPPCEPVVCATTPDEIPADILEYGRLVPFDEYPITYNESSVVECSSGAVVTGTGGANTSFPITCGPEGWFTSDGVCAIPCPAVPKVSHSVSKYFGKVIEYGQKPAIVQCKEGYVAENSGLAIQNVICLRNGTLSGLDHCIQSTGSGVDGTDGTDGLSQWPYQEGESFNVAAYMARLLSEGRSGGVTSVSVLTALAICITLLF